MRVSRTIFQSRGDTIFLCGPSLATNPLLTTSSTPMFNACFKNVLCIHPSTICETFMLVHLHVRKIYSHWTPHNLRKEKKTGTEMLNQFEAGRLNAAYNIVGDALWTYL